MSLFGQPLILVQDMTQAIPTQELAAKDLHGIEWRFKHIFRGDYSFHFALLPCAAAVVYEEPHNV